MPKSIKELRKASAISTAKNRAKNKANKLNRHEYLLTTEEKLVIDKCLNDLRKTNNE